MDSGLFFIVALNQPIEGCHFKFVTKGFLRLSPYELIKLTN
jgi:hypothetical protein